MDEETFARFGAAWDLPEERRYVGHETMLAEEDLDVVPVCTPSVLHRDHVVDAARSAADPDVIWCEKPIAASVADAEEMIDACGPNGTALVVNHSRCRAPTPPAPRAPTAAGRGRRRPTGIAVVVRHGRGSDRVTPTRGCVVRPAAGGELPPTDLSLGAGLLGPCERQS